MKRMKKFAVVALALMLMATQLVLASAEGLGNRTQDVKAKYSGGAAEPVSSLRRTGSSAPRLPVSTKLPAASSRQPCR